VVLQVVQIVAEAVMALPRGAIMTNRAGQQRNNLPAQLSSFIGRETEVRAICTLLQRTDVRFVTLTGVGGVGKTRLSLQVATELLNSFADGVYFVSLASISDPALVASTIAQVFGLKESRDRQSLDLLKAFLQERQLLLLLDNFEQVAMATPILLELLTVCPGLKLLTTSRTILHIRGEYVFPVSPLALPDLKHLPDSEALAQFAAVTLFLQRAQAIKPDFQMTRANASAIAEICTHLDGLPLAIELAVAHIRWLPPRGLLARLGHRLQVLTGGAKDLPERHQTLWNTLTWSYDLLNADEQRLFRRLSVFVGDCTLEALERVCDTVDGPGLAILERVSSLLDKSLIQQVGYPAEQEHDEPHLVMLETLREYGLDRLEKTGELEVTRQAHALYYLALAEEAEPKLIGAEEQRWLERLEGAHENLREALIWTLEDSGEQLELALRLGGALWRFWWERGHLSEGRSFLERALSKSEGMNLKTSIRAKALNAVGMLAALQGNYSQAEKLCGESLALFREIGEKQGIAISLYLQGQIAGWRSNYEAARSLTEEALAIFRELEDKWGSASSLDTLATVALNKGDYLKAFVLAEESLALSREIGDKGRAAHSLWLLAVLIFFQGDHARAHSLILESLALAKEVNDKRGIADALVISGYVSFFQGGYDAMRSPLEEGLVLHREVGDQRGMALALYGLGWLALGQGDYTAARDLYEESLALLRKLGHQWFVALCLEGLACVVAEQEQPAWAARLCGAAQAIRESINASRPPVGRMIYERAIAAARGQLGEDVFTAMLAEGRAMTLEQVLMARGPAMVTAQVPIVFQQSKPPTKVPTQYPDGLTSREVEVLRLVAIGLTDIQVAEQLVISSRTVSTHLTSIYAKIRVSTRTAAALYAIEHHLV